MRGERRQRLREAEAVGQEQVPSGLADRPFEIAGAVEDLADDRLRRRQVGVERLPGGAGGEPAPLGHPPSQGREELRMALLEQPVAIGTLEVEKVVGEAQEAVLVLAYRPRQEGLRGLAHRPAPLRVEVRERHDVEPRPALHLRRRRRRGRSGRGRIHGKRVYRHALPVAAAGSILRALEKGVHVRSGRTRLRPPGSPRLHGVGRGASARSFGAPRRVERRPAGLPVGPPRRCGRDRLGARSQRPGAPRLPRSRRVRAADAKPRHRRTRRPSFSTATRTTGGPAMPSGSSSCSGIATPRSWTAAA